MTTNYNQGYPSSFLYMRFADKYHDGFRVFDLGLYNQLGIKVDGISVLSGSSNRQYSELIHPSKDYAGSGNPLPEGVYDLGEVEDARNEGKDSFGEGIGRYWIRLNQRFHVNDRDAFGVHDDENREYSPGSAGCVCPFASIKMQTILSWMRQKARPRYLICDLGTGFLSDRDVKYPGNAIKAYNQTTDAGFLAAVEFVKSKEGLSTKAYPDPLTGSDPFTIGWGNIYYADSTPVKEGDTISVPQANALLEYWLKLTWKQLTNSVPFWGDMTKGQRAALASLAYNTGWTMGDGDHDTLDHYLKSKSTWDKVPSAIALYINAGSRVEAGLRARRQEEIKLWNT